MEAYAVYDTTKTPPVLLFRSEHFSPDGPVRTVPLSMGAELRISGEPGSGEETNEELRRRLQEALDENMAKETFLSNMSHDLRTPMNAIVGMTALAKMHIDEAARVSDALDKIEVASAHLLGLINEVLDVSRINSGKAEFSTEAFALCDLLHETLIIARPQALKKRQSFRFSASKITAESLYGDPARLRQIFVNIINNAIKYTPEEGSVCVDVSEEPEGDLCRLVFVCRDNGIGMSEEFLKKLFLPFERESSVTVSKTEGTGLGMAIVKKLVDGMGGTIHVESRPGEGTAVTVSVPMRYQKLLANTEKLQGKRLLIVERDAEMETLFRDYLDEYRVDYRIVPTSTDAVSALTDADFHGNAFDALVIGIGPSEDGNLFDIAAYVHRSHPELAIVLVGEQNWERIEYQARRCGIHSFIPIPVFRKSLLNGLNEALSSGSEESPAKAAPDLAGKRILLVEDNEINREIAVELLATTNAAVDTAENGQEAVDAFLAHDPGYYSLILMDIQMPVMDGYAAARAIRGSGRTDAPDVAIYAMSANAFAEDVAKAGKAGMNGHLAKPVDVQKLMDLLREFM